MDFFFVQMMDIAISFITFSRMIPFKMKYQ